MTVRVRSAMCAAILCLATAGFAQTGTNQSGTMNSGTAVSGSIVSVSSDVIVVRTDAGETMRFNRDASVNVPSNLMAGNRVSVQYNRLAADNMRLTRIDLDNDMDATRTTGVDDRRGTSSVTSTSGTSGSGTTGDNTYGNNNTDNNTYDNNTTANNANGYSRLPQTASPLVMVAFAGLVSLGGALALRARRRR